MSPVFLRVKELRVAKGLSQAEIAARAGLREATVNRIERNLVKGVDFLTLEKLSKALGVDAALLIATVPEKRGKRE
jgi:transcriptional regulator with XRE-family HTH domain